MSADGYGRDVRRELFRAIPALDALKGAERFRAEEVIERVVENAIDDHHEAWRLAAEGVP